MSKKPIRFSKSQVYITIPYKKFNVQHLELKLESNYYNIAYAPPNAFKLDGITFETPWMSVHQAPYKTTPGKYYINLSFKNIEEDSDIAQFYKTIREFEVATCVRFPQFQHIYSIKTSIDPSRVSETTNSKGLAKLQIPADNNYIKLKIGHNQNNIILNNCHIDTDTDEGITSFFDKIDITGGLVKAIIQCNGMWNYNNCIGFSWKVISMRISKPGINLVEFDNIEDTNPLPYFEFDVDDVAYSLPL